METANQRLRYEKEELSQQLFSNDKKQSEDKNKKEEEKQKKELNKELSKVKKSVREKDKEIFKLKTEISAFKKVDVNIVRDKSQVEQTNKEQQDLGQQVKNL